MRLLALQVFLLLALAPGFARAEIYRWTDAQGQMHFTQNLSQVPPQYRAEAEARAKAPQKKDSIQRVQTYAVPTPAAQPRGGSAPSAADGTVYRIRVARAGTGMLVQVRLNRSVTAPFLLDTGASDVLIPQAVADQLGLRVGPEARTKRYTTANGVVTHPIVMLRSVDLGGAVVENVPASVSPDMQVGLLGLSFFNHFTYNIDAAAGVVTLRPNRLVEVGKIRGGRSEAQWRAEYQNLHARIAQLDAERARKPTSHHRELRRIAERREELERQLALLEGEADRARVPMAWRDH
jgi:clan AA aspartic protease (TIGR02281 family)